MVSDMPQVAHGQPVPVVANYISPVARIPIIMAWAIGTMHIINVAISFSQLGFPLAQSPRPAAGVPSISVVDVRGRAALGTRTLVTYVRPIRLDTECASCSADSPHNKSDEALLDVEEDQTPDDGVSFFGYYTAVSRARCFSAVGDELTRLPSRSLLRLRVVEQPRCPGAALLVMSPRSTQS